MKQAVLPTHPCRALGFHKTVHQRNPAVSGERALQHGAGFAVLRKRKRRDYKAQHQSYHLETSTPLQGHGTEVWAAGEAS